MNDQRLEKLSALIDDELGEHLAAGLVDQIADDPGLRCAWERYHLIGQALRGETVHPAARGIAESVGQALRSEPIPIRRRPRRSATYSRLAPFGGAALAAGAALLAVFAVPNLFQGPHSRVPDVPDPPIAAAAQGGAVVERRWDLDRPDLASKLDLFLVNHQDAAPAAGVKGMLPYATLVGYEAAH
ncbi:MAG: sigma-E factor negative regulatory protein [Bdellovibrio bacteriovorus]